MPLRLEVPPWWIDAISAGRSEWAAGRRRGDRIGLGLDLPERAAEILRRQPELVDDPRLEDQHQRARHDGHRDDRPAQRADDEDGHLELDAADQVRTDPAAQQPIACPQVPGEPRTESLLQVDRRLLGGGRAAGVLQAAVHLPPRRRRLQRVQIAELVEEDDPDPEPEVRRPARGRALPARQRERAGEHADPVELVVEPAAEDGPGPVEPGELAGDAVEDEAQVVQDRADGEPPRTGGPETPCRAQAQDQRPTESRLGVSDVRFAMNRTRRPASGSTRKTVHQASRALYVRDRTSSIVNRAVTMPPMPRLRRTRRRALGCLLLLVGS